MSQFLTKKDIIKEIVSCGQSPQYFINNYCKISHPQLGLIPFKTWDFQNDLLQSFLDYNQNIILKSRQLGISWISAAYAAWLMMFRREKSIMAMATQQRTARNVLKKVKFIIKNLPPWFDQIAKILADNENNFTLTNGSEFKAASTATDVGRSESLSLLIIDEAAHIRNMEDVWTAAGPCMSAGGRCIALSSPKGVGTWFHTEWVKAEKGENEFHPTKLTWEVHPERDEEWEKKERKKYSAKKFDQEYNASFLASGDTIISSGELTRIFKSLKQPVFKTAFDKNLYIWEKYNSSKTYLLVADVARGDGADFSAFHVLDVENMNQVAEYKAKITTDIYSKLLFDVGKEYGECMLVIEMNNLGYEMGNKLLSYGYNNLYFETKGSHEYVEPYLARNLENVLPGFTTSHTTKPMLINKLEESIRRGFITINSERTYKELETFIWNKGKAEAQGGNNDDLVISLAIGCWVRDTALKASIRSLQFKRTFLNSIKTTRTLIDTKIPGMIGYNNKISINKPYIDQVRKKYGWILAG